MKLILKTSAPGVAVVDLGWDCGFGEEEREKDKEGKGEVGGAPVVGFERVVARGEDIRCGEGRCWSVLVFVGG